MTRMAMFPLGSVLFPGAVLPLHVFEPRYRQMVRDCLANPEPEFGAALITRGSEVGGGDTRSMVATIARVVQVTQFDDGRYALVAVGTRRVLVDSWLPDDPYPLAHVHDWPDEHRRGDEREPGEIGESFLAEPRLATVLNSTFAKVRRINALAAEMGGVGADLTATISDDVVLGSYQLCTLAPLGPADQQRLLSAAGPSERLRMLDEALADVEALLQFRLQHESGNELLD